MDDSHPLVIVVLCTIVVLGVVLAVVRAWLKGRKLRREQAAAEEAARAEQERRAQQAAWAASDRFAEHHRPHWSPNAAQLGKDPLDWAMLLGAPFALCRGAYNDVLVFQDVDAERETLAQAWGVYSRATMLRTLYDVHQSGHRYSFTREVTSWSQLSEEQARLVEADLIELAEDSDEGAEELWRFRRVRQNDRNIRSANFLAWDYVRLAMLARGGATTGYISEAEAADILLMIAPDIRAHYSSWEELATSFHLGRWYWNSEGGAGEANLDAHDSSRQRILLGDNGPWSFLPWETDVPASRLLLADAVHREGLIAPHQLGPRKEASVTALHARLSELQATEG